MSWWLVERQVVQRYPATCARPVIPAPTTAAPRELRVMNWHLIPWGHAALKRFKDLP
jgi:hypothetical protein